MKQKLIVNADDFGIHTAVNHAVCRAFEEGILTSTSLMAGGAAFEEAVSIARTIPGIGIGVHLTLVGGLPTVLPASEVSTLTWEGGILCKDYAELILRDLKGKISADDVYREWDAQIQKVLDTGLPVTHLDGHQHMHMWPHFFPVARALAEKYHIRCMRVPDEDLFWGWRLGGLFRIAARNGLALIARSHRSALRKAKIRMNDHFYGMICGGHLREAAMLQILSSLQRGVNEIMCHPSADAEAMEAVFHWGYHGDWELASLLSEDVRDFVEEKGVQLISYRDI